MLIFQRQKATKASHEAETKAAGLEVKIAQLEATISSYKSDVEKAEGLKNQLKRAKKEIAALQSARELGIKVHEEDMQKIQVIFPVSSFSERKQ